MLIEAGQWHASFSMQHKVSVMPAKPLHFMHILNVHRTPRLQAATEEQLMIRMKPTEPSMVKVLSDTHQGKKTKEQCEIIT